MKEEGEGGVERSCSRRPVDAAFLHSLHRQREHHHEGEGLLPEAEIEHIISTAPADLIRFQERAAALPIETRPTLESWLDRLLAQHLTEAA